jgi:hypothetical protein
MQDILCVEYDNSAVQGDFYILDPSHNISDSLESFSMHNSSLSTIVESSHIPFALNGTYSFGDRLLSFYGDENTTDELFFYPGLFQIVSSSDAGYCNSIKYAEFGKNMDSSCVTLIDALNLQDLCSDILSIDRAVRQIWGKKNFYCIVRQRICALIVHRHFLFQLFVQYLNSIT